MESDLKLYIWRETYNHIPYGGGIAFAVAASPEDARNLIMSGRKPWDGEPDLSGQPEVHSGPYAAIYSWSE